MTKFDYAVPPALPKDELSTRLNNFRKEMGVHSVDALIVASYADFEYLIGHLYYGWELHAARPLYAIVTADSFVVVASPSDKRLLELEEHSFSIAYYNGFQAEATEVVIDTIKSYGATIKTIAIDYGPEINAIGNIHLIDGLRNISREISVISAAPIVWSVRKIKSEYEAEMKRRALVQSHLAFNYAVENAYLGITEKEMVKLIKHALLQYGAERVDAMALKFGKGDFLFNQLPGERTLEDGMYVWGDFYNTYYGYPSDTCRIARCGEASQEEQNTYRGVRAATIELCNNVKVGMTGGEIYKSFEKIWAETNLPPIYAGPGRIGHSSGKEILEPFSIASWETSVVEPGMILHFEPKLEMYGGVFQFEEVIYVKENSVEFLTPPFPKEIPIIPGL